ncbi:MAG: glycosyltransferase [Elusimicrobia bacterium]|nr:glycosyltransferase [Elusimicrobiota bacterium]
MKDISTDRRIFVLLPAYNETAALKKLVPAIHEELRDNYTIVVVDDGSSDGTSDLCRDLSGDYMIVCLSHETNRGLGEAVRTGLAYITENSSPRDLMAIMDADNTHDPSLMRVMASKAREYDIVIASRYETGARQVGVSLLRRFLSGCAGKLFSMVFAVKNVRDYTCGYRIYRMSIFRDYLSNKGTLPVSEKGFPVMVEMLVKLAYSGARCAEVPLVLRYDRKETPSSIRIIKTILQYFLLIFRIRFSGGRIRKA